MKKLLLIGLAVFLVGCTSAEEPIDMGDGIGDGTMGSVNQEQGNMNDLDNEEAGDVEYFEGEYRFFDPVASRGDQLCMLISSASSGQLPSEFLTADEGDFPLICFSDGAVETAGLESVFADLEEGCRYSEAGNYYTIGNLRIDPSQEYEKRADLISVERYMNGSTVCE